MNRESEFDQVESSQFTDVQLSTDGPAVEIEVTPETAEQYPALTESLRHYEEDMSDWLAQVRQVTSESEPEGYVFDEGSVDVLDAANPHLAIPIFLKRRGAPIAIVEESGTDEDGSYDVFSVGLDPSIREAYEEFWSEAFGANPRRLANSIARGLITRHDAAPETFHVAPIVNRDILWAQEQGILMRAYVTSALALYAHRGIDIETPGSLYADAEFIERLITEQHVMPFSLDTVLGMGEAVAAAVLAQNPELVERLGLDPELLTQIESKNFEVNNFEAAFDTYWKPVFDRIRAEEAIRNPE